MKPGAPRCLAGLWCLALPAALAAAPPAPANGGPAAAMAPSAPMTVLLLDDVKDHGKGAHDYPLWQERWARLLGGTAAWGAGPVNLHGEPGPAPAPAGWPGAAGVRVLKAHGWPSPQQLDAANVVVAFCYLKWNQERLDAVRRYLSAGKGWVAIHSATWTKPQPSPAVGGVLGVGGFRFYRHGPIRLRIETPEHPVCAGLPREFDLDDETYWPPTPAPAPPVAGFTVLASSPERIDPAAEKLQAQPMFWTWECGGGRVFGCVPGHFTRTFDDPHFRLLLLRGIAWAGGSPPGRFDALAPLAAGPGR